MPILSLKNVGVRVPRKWILRDIDLDVLPEEMLSIFGPTGSGKSTLARILAGLAEADKGTVAVDSGAANNRRSIALQNFGLAGELTVHENLMLFASLAGLTPRARSRKVAFLTELLRLGEWRNTRAGNIPAGAAVKVEIARALLPEAAVYIFDSLLDNLSAVTLERVWDYLLNVRRSKKAAVIVITGLGKIAQMCSKMAVMVGGSIGYYGSPEEFRRMAGDDMVVVGDLKNPIIKNKIKEQFAVTISEEEGFLSFRAGSSDKVVADLLSEFGADLGCVYLKRPTIEDALEVSMGEIVPLAVDLQERT